MSQPSGAPDSPSAPIADRGEITTLLRSIGAGDSDALNRLFPLVYHELHRLAASHLRRERLDHTLQTTALVNEAYLRLVDQSQAEISSRGHFLAIAARAMRRILVDHARGKNRQKRSAPGERVAFMEADDAMPIASDADNVDLVALDAALERLGAMDERKQKVVEMRFFAGMTIEETAAALNVGAMTVKRDWEFARLWLLREMGGGSGGDA